MYLVYMHKRLNLSKPTRYTEKQQWMKLFYRNPLYDMCVDKLLVKDYVDRVLGEGHTIPTIGSWDNTEEIFYENLPNSFVLKTNHFGGGRVFICKDKGTFNWISAKKELNKQLCSNRFWNVTREWPYRNIKRKIICEKYMEDESGGLRDYKFYCFNGIPKFCLIASNRFTAHNFTFFDMDFHRLNLNSVVGKQDNCIFEKPKLFEKMKEYAAKLSAPFCHVRVDLYCCNEAIYFGEFTFFDSSGYDNFGSDEWDKKMGDWMILPARNN